MNGVENMQTGTTMERRKKDQFVKDLREKDAVISPFLVKFSAVAVDKSGRPYMNIILMDKSGEVEARIWENVPEFAGQAVKDSFVWVKGRCQSYQGRRQVVIKELQVLREDEIEVKDYLLEGSLDINGLYEKLLGFIDSMKDPYIKALAEAVFRDDKEIVEKVKRAPAAKSVHHIYIGGLLDHMVSVTDILDGIARHYGSIIDRDLLIFGGFMHDIGKTSELSYERVTDYTTEGRLVGHIVLGAEMVDKKIRELEAQPGRLPGKFPEEKRLLIKHIILSHHGQLEYGSPKRPKSLEAMLVHMVDDMDSKVNAIKTFIERDQNPQKWTAFNQQYDRFFYKPDNSKADEE